MALTVKQTAFIDAYISNCGNATQAAIFAGYSKQSAYSQGQRMLKNVEIKSALDERIKELESERIAKDTEVLELLTAIMRGELKEEVVVQVGTGKGYSHAEIMEKRPSIKDRLNAASQLSRILDLQKPDSEIDDVIIMLPEKNKETC